MSSFGTLVLVVLSWALAAGDLDTAEKALAAGKPRAALDALGDLADHDGAPLRALLVQGRAFLRLREYEGAVEALLRAHELSPKDTVLARDATYACWYASAGAGAYASAYLADAKRMSLKAGEPRLIADVHFAAGDYEDALRYYGDVADDDKTRLFLRERRALCLRYLGRNDEARIAYASALDEALRRGDLQAAFRTAFPARQQGRFLQWLDARLESDAKDFEARRFRGYVRAEVLRHADAAADFRKVLEKRPEDIATRMQLSDALLRLGLAKQKPEAIAECESQLRQILARKPDHRVAWDRMVWLARWHWTNGEVKKSYGLLKKLVEIDGTDFDNGLNFGAMARRLGHYAEAEAVYKRLLELSPNDADVLNDLAIVRDGLGDRAGALVLWRRVLEVDEKNLNALENLLTAAWERGDRVRAEEILARGLKAARRPGGPLQRWEWFQDRMSWCPKGFGP